MLLRLHQQRQKLPEARGHKGTADPPKNQNSGGMKRRKRRDRQTEIRQRREGLL